MHKNFIFPLSKVIFCHFSGGNGKFWLFLAVGSSIRTDCRCFAAGYQVCPSFFRRAELYLRNAKKPLSFR